jgi:hypothetical protein
VADANEALGEQVEQKAAQELIERYGHQSLLIVVSRVPPTKGNLAVDQRDQSMVGDGHAMGVAAQVLEHIVGAAEGWFGVNDPVFSEQWPEPGSEDFGLREQSQIAGKLQLAMLKGRLESGDELAAKHTSEYLDGEEEVRTGSDPAGVIEGEPTGRDDAVDMGMNLEFLVPGVEHAEDQDVMDARISQMALGFCTPLKKASIT